MIAARHAPLARLMHYLRLMWRQQSVPETTSAAEAMSPSAGAIAAGGASGASDGASDGQRSWHALAVAEALAEISSDRDGGLSEAEAQLRLERFGPNELPTPRRRSAAAVFFGQFKSPLIYLLFGAAGIALVLGELGDAVVIFTVVLLNACIGAFQEGRAERSLAALRSLATHQARVRRGGQALVVATREVVPGDILELEAGDAVAADARLVDGAALQIAEAALTGESVPVAKSVPALAIDTPLADRHNMVYAGTHVTAGRARAVVVAVGQATELGRIAALAEAAVRPATPLEQRVAQFGRTLVLVAAVMFVAVVGIGLLRGLRFGEIVMIAISQVVGMIPEGLPVAMTIALAVGVQRMARRQAVVRQLAAVETLGATTVICSDKTGTLTRNEMTVTELSLASGRELTVTGGGYDPEGAVLESSGAPATGLAGELDAELRALLEAAVLCNDAALRGPGEAEPRWTPIGDPTEVALIVLAIKAGILPEELRARTPRRAELPFDPETKMMATQHQTSTGPRVVVKGAPELVLELCGAMRRDGRDVPLDEPARRQLHRAAEQMARRALRVLAVGVLEAHGEAEAAQVRIDGAAGFEAFRARLSWLGLIGSIDPPRAEVKDAVARCHQAGIRTAVITGDLKTTACAIARELGILERDAALEGEDAVAIDGRELAALSEAELARRIGQIAVFARVHPAQKLRIVEAYQRRGEVVAMTGDGVNDAPALAQADVGVAMGRSGTEVAKESAKIVIGDDNFASIVAAVEEGRVVYRNIKKAVLLLFSTSAAEMVVLLAAMLLGYAPPFVAVQILWNNLVTEGLITVNLVMEPPEGDEMQQPPIARDERLLTRVLLTRMAFMVPAIVASTLGWFVLRTAAGVSPVQVRAETFTLLAICEWFNVLNCRSETHSALTLSVLRNRWLLAGLLLGNLLQVLVVFWPPAARVFHTVPFGPGVVVALALVGSLVLWVEELRKLVVRRRSLSRGVAMRSWA